MHGEKRNLVKMHGYMSHIARTSVQCADAVHALQDGDSNAYVTVTWRHVQRAHDDVISTANKHKSVAAFI
jgi:hypothetical protein